MTREEQIEEYCQRYCDKQGFSSDGGFNIYSPMAIVASDAIKWADEHPKSPWIPVEERLPEEDYNCIVTNKLGGGTSIAYYLKDAEEWLDAYTGEEIHGITHWFRKPKFDDI